MSACLYRYASRPYEFCSELLVYKLSCIYNQNNSGNVVSTKIVYDSCRYNLGIHEALDRSLV
jgi:hypothetical protein